MVGDGEAVRLVADALHQVERLRRARQDQRLSAMPRHEYLLVLLGQANRWHLGHAQLVQHLERGAELALAAVDDNQIRHDRPGVDLGCRAALPLSVDCTSAGRCPAPSRRCLCHQRCRQAAVPILAVGAAPMRLKRRRSTSCIMAKSLAPCTVLILKRR